MSDFLKRFRRQRSVKQSTCDNDENISDNVLIPSDNEKDLHKPVERHSSISSESCNSAMIKNKEENEGFKEPKGWRKSLRKLKIKKRAPTSSISFDNISKMPNNLEKTENNVKYPNPDQETSISKRWSYSPDLCEDNVPGARELRGTIERKLSVKHEVDEKSCISKYHQVDKYEKSKSTKSYSNFLDNKISNATKASSFLPSSNENLSVGVSSFHSPESCHGDVNTNVQMQINSDSSSLSALLEKTSVQDYTSSENVDRQYTAENDTAYATSISRQSASSIHQSTSGHSMFSSDVEDDQNMYSTEAHIPCATLTTLHGQQEWDVVNDKHDSDGVLTSPWVRERTLTKFEREAESVLENCPPYDYNDQYCETYRKNTESHFEEPIADSDESRDSHEFDSTCDELDEKKDNKEEKKETKLEKLKESSKKRFWDRPALKKKHSVSEPSGADNFADLHIPKDRFTSPQLPTSPPLEITENQLKRRRIVGTILSSEQSYIESLQRVETAYKQTLLDAKPPIIAADTVEKIFYKISAILQCHRLFQMALASAAHAWDEKELIGNTFVASFSKEMVLECYCDFINNFAAAMETVRKTCLRKQQFLNFLQDRQAESSDRLTLYSLMLKPVQRFPQFIMLVQDLLKHTPSDHPDRLPLQLALTELETLANRLNRRKALDEDASNLSGLNESSNVRLGPKTKDGRIRRLIRHGDVRECELNESGLLEKIKDCLLILTNDLLICCSISNRKPQQRGVTSTYKDMYKLKWKVELGDVDVFDGPHGGAEQRDREDLHADFIALHEISRIVGRLRLSHEGLTEQVVTHCIRDVETRIRQAEQLASHPDEASFTVKFPEKSDTTNRTMVLRYHSEKEKWLSDISKAKLANTPGNIDCWFAPDTTEGDLGWDSPLFLRSLSVHMAHETSQVQCAHAFMPTSDVTVLWLSCAASTVLAVISVYYITEEKVEKVHVMQVKSSVQCMEHWSPFGSTPSIWLGMESGSLLEYSSNGRYRKLSEVSTPTLSTVMIVKSHLNHLYVGLLDGSLALYTLAADNTELQLLSSVVVGSGPLKCLFPEGDKLWVCSGNSVATVDLEKFATESSHSLLLDGEKLVVNLVTRVGRGLWVTFTHSCSLNLYHLGSLERLQEINLSRLVRDFAQSLERGESIDERFHITSLCAAHTQLFVGTSNGLLMAMPLTKLPESVPKITGPCLISRHALSGSLSFLFAPQLPIRPRLNANNIPEGETKEVPHVFRNDVAPPIPRRDDLDDVVPPPNHRFRDSSKHPATVSYHYRDVPDLSGDPPSTPPKPYRYSVPARLSSSVVESLYDSPRLSLGELSPAPELVDRQINLESLESPCEDTFVKWNERSARQSLLLLACGEGYVKYGPKQEAPLTLSPAILCWKVFL